MHVTNISMLTALALTAGCAAAPEGADLAPSAQLQAPAASAPLYFVGRDDARECDFPECGGFYVRALNVETLTCPDGTQASECRVPHLDASALGEAGLDGFGSGRVIVRGTLGLADRQDTGTKLPALIAAAGWRAVGPIISSTPDALYVLANNGALTATAVNTTTTVPVSKLALPGTALSAAQQKQLDGALANSGALATGPAPVSGAEFVASRLYLPIGAAECWSASDCTSTLYGLRVNSKEDCYCLTCPVVLSAAAAKQNEADWQALCAADNDPNVCWELPCGDVPPPSCVSGQCAFDASATQE